MDDENFENIEEPVELVIDGVLDLHPFSPKDLKDLIPDYIDECLKLGILDLKIIHGKGIGNIRRSVHSLLDRNPNVLHYKLGNENSGSWGATIIQLKKTGNE
jgi:dsDNA-specific endonuclease/ATPase MutS2